MYRLSNESDSFIDEFIQAYPRIVLALIIAIVISRPLEYLNLPKEIDSVLLKDIDEMAIANKEEVANF